MQYLIPHYYKEFRCSGGVCPDTCCAGWQIQIDPASLKRYRKTKGALGSRLHNEIDWKEQSFRRYSGRCAFLNEENLCDLYLEGGGERAFCKTCRTYPRHIEEFEGLREISLSLSCPEAARLILGLKEPVRFLHTENEREETLYEDFDFFLFTKLSDARSLILSILQNREKPVHVRLAVVLALAHDIQQRIDRNALFQTDDLLKRYSAPPVFEWFEHRLNCLTRAEQPDETGRRTLNQLFGILNHLEILRPDWKPFVQNAQKILERNLSCMLEQNRQFRAVFTDRMTEQLMVYFVFTYFCGAVYNENAYGKMKFAFAGTILIRELCRAQWLESIQNGVDDADSVRDPEKYFPIFLRTAWRYAREIEHSDQNKCRMEELLGDEERFGLENLFSLL